MRRAPLFVVAFLLAAFSVTLWMMRHITPTFLLHINDRWSVFLVGERDAGQIRFSPLEFTTVHQQAGELGLQGNGTIDWQDRTIRVEADAIVLGTHRIEVSNPKLSVHVMFYPDGRVTKGPAVLK